MTPGLVLIHGGAHAADSWDLVVDELTLRAPELRVLAVDLPGRRSNLAQLSTLRIADWVGSVVTDVESGGLGDVVVVGHSLAAGFRFCLRPFFHLVDLHVLQTRHS